MAYFPAIMTSFQVTGLHIVYSINSASEHNESQRWVFEQQLLHGFFVPGDDFRRTDGFRRDRVILFLEHSDGGCQLSRPDITNDGLFALIMELCKLSKPALSMTWTSPDFVFFRNFLYKKEQLCPECRSEPFLG